MTARNPADLERAERIGFLGTWSVASGYAVEGGVLRVKGPMVRRYLPAAFPELATEISKLHEGDEAAVLRFAQVWGSPGYLALLDTSSETDAVSGWQRDRAYEMQGDPLPWLWAHARGIRTCLALLDHLQRLSDWDAQRDLRSLLDGLTVPPGDNSPDPEIVLTSGARWLVRRNRFPLLEHQTQSERAASIIDKVLNDNLGGITVQSQAMGEDVSLNAFGEERRRQVFGRLYGFGGLTDMAYWHLQDMVIGQLSIGQCPCGAWFPKRRPKQRYCPPPDWQSYGRGESRCQKRFYMRDVYRKKSVKKGGEIADR